MNITPAMVPQYANNLLEAAVFEMRAQGLAQSTPMSIDEARQAVADEIRQEIAQLEAELAQIRPNRADRRRAEREARRNR